MGAVSGVDVKSTCVGWLWGCLLGGSPRSGEFAVDGEVHKDSVGGVVIGSEWAGCGPESSNGMDGVVGVLAK